MTIHRSAYNSRLSSLSTLTANIAKEMAKVQERATTGLNITRPSDSPTDVIRLHRVKAQVEDQEVWIDYAEYAYCLLTIADDAMTDMSSVVSDARELAVMMASETYSSEQRSAASTDAQGLVDQFLDLLNSNMGERYIFAGNAYDSLAYDDTGAYLGDTGVPWTSVGESTTVNLGFDGSDLFQDPIDIVSALTELVTALESGDADAVSATLDDLVGATDQISLAHGEVGMQMNLAEDALEFAEVLQVDLATEVSRIEDADMVETYTRLTEVQTAYEAALQVLAKSSTSTLLSRI